MKKILAIFYIVIIILLPIKVNALESNIETNNQYTISFNTNGGSSINSQIILENNKISKPNDPNKDGFIFDGWYIDANLSNKYDFNTNITDNITLYAKWIESIKITYDLNGGIPTNNYNQVVYIPKTNNKININDLKNNICNTPNGYAFIGLEVNGVKYNINKTKNITLQSDSNIKFLWNKLINEVKINLNKPYVGDTTSLEKDSNGNWNWEKPNNVPNATSIDSTYKVVESYWVSGFKGTELDTPFIGTFESGKKYYAEIYIEASDGYQFNDSISVIVNGQDIDSLILMENNSSQYGTSYMSIGKIIIPNEKNVPNVETKTVIINQNNNKIENNKTSNNEEISNNVEENNINNLDLTKLSTDINQLNNNFKLSSINNVSTSDNLPIWYGLVIISIIGLSIIYIKYTY